MNARPAGRDAAVRRILVAIDAVSDCRAAIERAAAMAAEHQAELAGMFVEDLDLLRMCELPGSEVVFTTGATRRTDRREMERHLKSRAEVARRTLEQIAGAHHLHWSFEVRRARMLNALREAAELADVVAADVGGPRLATVSGARPAVLAYFEGGANGARVMALAVRAAVQQAAPLTVLLPARDAASATRAAADVQALLRHHDVDVTLERVATGVAALRRRLSRGGTPLLFIAASGRLIAGGALPALSSARGCEIVLVSRGPRADGEGD